MFLLWVSVSLWMRFGISLTLRCCVSGYDELLIVVFMDSDILLVWRHWPIDGLGRISLHYKQPNPRDQYPSLRGKRCVQKYSQTPGSQNAASTSSVIRRRYHSRGSYQNQSSPGRVCRFFIVFSWLGCEYLTHTSNLGSSTLGHHGPIV